LLALRKGSFKKEKLSEREALSCKKEKLLERDLQLTAYSLQLTAYSLKIKTKFRYGTQNE
jgi:hypothetical protein